MKTKGMKTGEKWSRAGSEPPLSCRPNDVAFLRTSVPPWFQRRTQRGTALIVAMAIVLLLAGLTTAMLMELSTRADRTEADSEDIKSFEAAEAGLDAAIKNLNTGGNGTLGIGWNGDANDDGKPNAGEVAAGGWHVGLDNVQYSAPGYSPPPGRVHADQLTRTYLPNTTTPDPNSPYPMPRPQPREFNFYQHAVKFGDVRYYTYAIPWAKDGVDNDGNGVTDGNGTNDPNEQDWYTVYSTGFSSEYLMKLSSNENNPLGKFTTVEAIVFRLSNTVELQAALEFQFEQFQPAP